MAIIGTSIFFIIIGLILGGGGLWLVTLGGSIFYLFVGLIMFGMPTYLAFTSRLVPAADIPPRGQDEKGSEQGLNRNDGAPYGVFMGPFLGLLQIPCQAPPWGYVAGVDLRTGKIAYMHKNGTVRDMTPLPLPFKLGVPGIGGPMLTKGASLFSVLRSTTTCAPTT